MGNQSSKLEFSESEIVSFKWSKAESYELKESDDDHLFIVSTSDAKYEPIHLEDLYDPDSKRPVHVELEDIDPLDPSDCFEFIDKWGHLGMGFRWNGIRIKSTTSEPTLADAEVLLPKYLNRSTSEWIKIDGREYFDIFFRCDPKSISMPESWIMNFYNLADFQGMDYYREWIGEQHADDPPNPEPFNHQRSFLSKGENPQFIFSFSFGVHVYQSFFQFSEDIEKHLNDTFGQDLKSGKIKKQVDTAIPIENTKITLDHSTQGGTQVTFWPRTLIDCCYVLAGIDDLKKCLNCNGLTSSNNKLHDGCKDSFMKRRLWQAEEFKECRDKELDVSSLPDWPVVDEGQNPRHPAELLEGDPLEMNPERTMEPKELEFAKCWAQDFKEERARSSSKRGNFDLLLDLFID